MSVKPAISLQNLNVTLSGGTRALRQVSAELPAGQITGLIGPSGAGKSTLIRVLVGLQRPGSGQASVLGLPAGHRQLRRRIGYMTQAPAVYSDLTVGENLAFFAALRGTGKAAVMQVLEETRLSDFAGRTAANLSGGQRSRLSLAIALLGDPDLLVLDEPTVGLDPVLRQELWRLFRHLAEQGKTLIISSHVMDEAGHCDSLLLLRDGQVIAHDTPQQIMLGTHTESVEDAFLKLVPQGVAV